MATGAMRMQDKMGARCDSTELRLCMEGAPLVGVGGWGGDSEVGCGGEGGWAMVVR